MFDLHTHTLFSDGELLPSELVRRAEHIGLKAIAITDHLDISNIDTVIPKVVEVSVELNKTKKIKTIPGAEITHCPPGMIGGLVSRARVLGAQIVLVHGETIVEPVEKGTNRAAIEAGVDILAHPGLISLKDAELAARKGIFLELSGRRGHCFANGHVLSMARQCDAKVIINSDTHSPGDLMSSEMSKKIALGAGLTAEEYRVGLKAVKSLINKY